MNIRPLSSCVFYAVFAVFLLLVDRITKTIALTHALRHWWYGPLFIGVHINRGIACGIGDSDNYLVAYGITFLSSVVTFGVLWHAIQQYKAGRSIVSEVLVLCGAVSNIIDRIVYKGVIDFVGLAVGEYCSPIINLADAYITLGLALFAFYEYMRE